MTLPADAWWLTSDELPSVFCSCGHHLCGGPVVGFRLYGGRWLRVCWRHQPADLELVA